MNKSRITIGLILIILLTIAGVLIYGGITHGKHSNDIAEKPSQNTETAALASQNVEIATNPSLSSIKTLKSNETKNSKLANIPKGIYIKKYPGNFACFKFETSEGLIIITDPFQMDETIKPDIVTESHQDADHTDVSKLIPPYKAIYTVSDYFEKGISIKGYSGKHNKGVADGTNFIYVFDINSIKIAHFGSQGELPTEETLRRIGKVDILLIQASIRPQYANSKLNLEECNTIIKKLEPKIIIPEHGTPKLGKSLAEYLDVNIEYPNAGELVVTKKGLDELDNMKVIDLDTGTLY